MSRQDVYYAYRLYKTKEILTKIDKIVNPKVVRNAKIEDLGFNKEKLKLSFDRIPQHGNKLLEFIAEETRLKDGLVTLKDLKMEYEKKYPSAKKPSLSIIRLYLKNRLGCSVKLNQIMPKNRNHESTIRHRYWFFAQFFKAFMDDDIVPVVIDETSIKHSI